MDDLDPITKRFMALIENQGRVIEECTAHLVALHAYLQAHDPAFLNEYQSYFDSAKKNSKCSK